LNNIALAMNKTEELNTYLKSLTQEEQSVLGAIRDHIMKLVPTMQERLSRGEPFFFYQGKRAVGFRS
jgi:hypothetical protein